MIHLHSQTRSIRCCGGVRRSVGVAGCSGMGLVEMLLSMAVFAVVLGGLILVSESLRADTSDQQTRVTLRKLWAALTQYHDRHGVWPRCDSTAGCVGDLLADQATAVVIQSLWLGTDPRGAIGVLDGYGRPVRCVARVRDDTTLPDFVSAGPDGRFGDLASEDRDQRNAVMDNLYGSDLEAPSP